MFVKPFCKEAERILKQLEKDSRAYSDDMSFVKSFATKSKIRDLLNNDFLDIGYSRKKRKSLFVLPHNIKVTKGKNGFKFKKIF